MRKRRASPLAKVGSVLALGSVTAGALACGGSAQTHASAPSVHTQSAKEAADEKLLFARESPASLKAVPISVLEGGVSAKVDAAGTPTIKSDQNDAGELVSVVGIPIGTEAPISCTFRATRLDAGMVMGEVLARIATPEALDGRPFAPDVQVTASEGAPILTVMARLVEDGSPLLAKVAVAPRDGGTVICSHFEPGYRETFNKEVARVAGSFKSAKAAPTPRWHEVRRLEKTDAIAFEERDISAGAKPGQLTARSIFATFTEVQGHWLGIDGVSEETYEPKGGAVVEVTTKLAVAGKVFSDLKLTRTGAGKYAYEGKKGEEALSGTFATRAPITTQASRAGLVRSWLSSRTSEAHFLVYDDTANAKGPTDVVFKRDAASGGGPGASGSAGGSKTKVTIETHGAKVSSETCLFDANGFCETSESAGDGTRETRLFARGTP